MLTQHLQAGNIRRIARGVFASVPKHAEARTWTVDRFLAASRLHPGGVIAYHAAMELHGYAYTESHEVQVIARGEPCVHEANGLVCRFVKPPRGFAGQNGAPTDGVMVIDRLGLALHVTTVERTITDLFDRYDLAGGAEELLNSLDLVARIDAGILVRYAHKIGNATAAGAYGIVNYTGNMSPEFMATIGVGIALAGLILRQGARLDKRIDKVAEELADVRDRLSRLEGLIEGLFRPRPVVQP